MYMSKLNASFRKLPHSRNAMSRLTTCCNATASSLLALTLVFGSALSASGQGNETLDNAAVIKMQTLGLGEAVIVEKIKTARGNFDTSLDGLKQLKEAGVSDEVIRNMIAAPSATPKSTGPGTTADVNDPKSQHDAGVWLYEEKDGKPTMTHLEPSVYSQAKSGGGMFMAYGATAKSEAILHPAHASLRTENRRPVFYFYFEKTQSGLSDMRNSTTSPSEFVLTQFKIDEKNKLRKLVVGQVNAYSGSQTGPEDKAVRSFDFEKISAGIYKVQSREDLANGEYGFFSAGSGTMGAYAGASGGKILDFTVAGAPGSESLKTKSKTKAKKTEE